MLRTAAALALLYAAWAYYRSAAGDASADAGGGWVNDLAEEAGGVLDSIEGALGFMNIGAMKNVDPQLLNHGNVRAFLRVIRTGEGTADEAGYRRLFGGALFTGYADHPRQLVKKNGYSSTAAGAYQFLATTWDETRRLMGLADFSPRSQDLGALGRIAARGALADVVAGRFESAVKKCAWEWASLPGSPYGQPVISLERARSVFAAAGGTVLA